MKRMIYVVISIFLAVNVFGQSGKSLSQQLWDRVGDTVKDLEGAYGSNWKSGSGAKIVDDSRNGYLQIIAQDPQGTVSETVAAYTNQGGGFTFLQRYTYSVNSWFKITSSRPLKDVLPAGFGSKDFMPNYNGKNNGFAFFYVDIDIPKVGTATKLTVKTIPFGKMIKQNDVICYEHIYNDGSFKIPPRDLRVIITGIKDAQTLQHLLDGQYKKISKNDAEVIEKNLMGKKQQDLTVDVKYLKQIYDAYTQIEFKSIILDWDISKSRFFVKSKVNADKVLSFRDFLVSKENKFHEPMF